MLQNCTELKIARVFFREPTTPHYLKEISRKSKIAHTSISKVLPILKKELIIKERIEQKGKRKFPIFSANLESSSYKNYKKINNLLELVSSGAISFIKESIMPKVIVLFGSYAKGEDIENSDIDLFVGSSPQKINLLNFEKILGRKIQIHFKKNFNEYPNELKNNILNGSVLSGHLEAFK
ncbi:MAG: nucleotidyltransferase domain-containing protein [Nanoarchaeota archaeon]